ncbi:DUF1648 domain-containing protein [Halosegnis marinus]|uniref:DUF1648 domain-containing protein n=1 Tax=Halosegnis marinus TaxID=3034023 RepID=A0ABD5ZKF8_9EURY|nr:DUF1648 domain-containing protein [Halosegnis sp. DT85]
MNVRSSDLAAYVLLALPVLAGLLLWGALPDRMAIHFGTSGAPDNYVARPLGVVLAPGVGLFAVLVTRYAPDWLSRTYTAPQVERATVVFVAGVVAYVQGFVLAWNLGYRADPTLLAVAPVLVAAGAFAVYTYARGGASA